uniref:Uncharacterized protein n=1 Tax=Strongyloides papillosus TaxID=174720 RepID=A0A0N5BQW3_STREA
MYILYSNYYITFIILSILSSQYHALESNVENFKSPSIDLVQNDLSLKNFIDQNSFVHSISGNSESKYLRKRQADGKMGQNEQKSAAKTKSEAKVPPKNPLLPKPKPPTPKPKTPVLKPKPPTPKPSVPRPTTKKPLNEKTATKKTTPKTTPPKTTTKGQTTCKPRTTREITPKTTQPKKTTQKETTTTSTLPDVKTMTPNKPAPPFRPKTPKPTCTTVKPVACPRLKSKVS